MMIIKYKNIYENLYVVKASNLLFLIAFISEITLFSLKKFGITLPHESLLLRVFCILFCLKIIMTRYTRAEWISILFCGILGVIAYFSSERGIDTLFRAAAMIAASKNISRRSSFKILFFSFVLVDVWTILQGFLGNQMLVDIRNYGRGTLEARYCFGFSHANIFHFSMWSLITIFLYLYHEKLKLPHYVALIAFNFVITFFTRSRTGFFLLLFTLILFAIFYTTNCALILSRYLFGAGLFILSLCLLLSFITILFGTDFPLMGTINSLLTNRVQWAHEAVTSSFLSLFSIQGNELLIDMGFVRLIYSFGVVPAAIYIIATVLLLWESTENKDYAAFIFLLTSIIYTTFEAQQINSDIAFNYTLLLLFGKWPAFAQIIHISNKKN